MKRDPNRCDWCRGRSGGCMYCPVVPESQDELIDMLMEKIETGEAEMFVRVDGCVIPLPPNRVHVSLSLVEEQSPRLRVCHHAWDYTNHLNGTKERRCVRCQFHQRWQILPEDATRGGAWIMVGLVEKLNQQPPAAPKRKTRKKTVNV